jgi:thymidylate kinase
MGHQGLVALEGLSGAGKSTQIALLQERTARQGGLIPLVTGWFETEHVKKIATSLDRLGPASPWLYAVTAAAEAAARLEHKIEPCLSIGRPVLAHRFTATPLTHEPVRGVAPAAVAALYRHFPTPALTLWLDTDPEEALARINLVRRPTYWEAGLDVDSGLPLTEGLIRYRQGAWDVAAVSRGFLRFQEAVWAGYSGMAAKGQLTRVEGRGSREHILDRLWELAGPALRTRAPVSE